MEEWFCLKSKPIGCSQRGNRRKGERRSLEERKEAEQEKISKISLKRIYRTTWYRKWQEGTIWKNGKHFHFSGWLFVDIIVF
jgi:hypothetical protein